MTAPQPPRAVLYAPGMGRGVRWSDVVAEIARDDEPELPPPADEREAS